VGHHAGAGVVTSNMGRLKVRATAGGIASAEGRPSHWVRALPPRPGRGDDGELGHRGGGPLA